MTDTITLPRSVVLGALETLEVAFWRDEWIAKRDAAITTLREALEQKSKRRVTYACPVCAASVEERNDDALTQQAFSIADDASVSIIETEFCRTDHVTYAIEADALAESDVLTETVDYLVARGLAHRIEAGEIVNVILEDLA